MVSDQFSDCHSFLAEIMQEDTSRAKALHDNPVKVAVIDNGADYVRTTISENIQEGISFVHTANRKYILPWWFVADPHGPQMAYLIRTVNPFCQLYIARVGTSRDDVGLDYAVEVSSIPFLSFRKAPRNALRSQSLLLGNQMGHQQTSGSDLHQLDNKARTPSPA
jgi:hypothetical protein